MIFSQRCVVFTVDSTMIFSQRYGNASFVKCVNIYMYMQCICVAQTVHDSEL